MEDKKYNYFLLILIIIFLSVLLIIFLQSYKAKNNYIDINVNLEGLAKEIFDSNNIKQLSIFGNTASTKDESGLFVYTECEGNSFYFRGHESYVNNNLVFAGFQWKIIRIDSDGNVKLIYNGLWDEETKIINQLEKNQNCGMEGYEECLTSISNSEFNHVFGNSKYTRYTYDDNQPSVIKEVLEEWYINNLVNYDNIIADVIYCNDLSAYDVTSLNVYKRTVLDFKPSLDCINQENSYGKDIGNKLLNQKVGLITADEIVLAGGRFISKNQRFYLFNNKEYWTMSPYYIEGNRTYMFHVGSNGSLLFNFAAAGYGVRPVIAIKPDVTYTGDGSKDNPYIINLNKY